MLIINKEPFFDLNPVERKGFSEDDKYILIERIRNLQSCIINELYKDIINQEYIEECNLGIEATLEEFYDENN